MSELTAVGLEGEPGNTITRHEVPRGKTIYFPGRYNSPRTRIHVLKGAVSIGLGVGNEPVSLSAPGPFDEDLPQTEYTTSGGYFDLRVTGPASFTMAQVVEVQQQAAEAA